MIPQSVIVPSADGKHEFSLAAQRLASGEIYLDGSITSELLLPVTAVFRECAQNEQPINLYLNSPGGEVYAGLAIYDLMQEYPYELNVYCIGLAASMAAILLAGGRKGQRFILPHSRVMIHEPLIAEGFGGSATTIKNKAKSILDVRSLVNGILAKHTGKSVKEIDKATSFDNFMNAEEAIRFGLCDEIRSIYDMDETEEIV
jgi:ATP-dependent Clp protease protease subunit